MKTKPYNYMKGIYITQEGLDNINKEIELVSALQREERPEKTCDCNLEDFKDGILFFLKFFKSTAKVLPESSHDWEDIIFDIIDENEEKFKEDGGFQVPIEVEEYLQSKFPNGLIISPKNN